MSPTIVVEHLSKHYRVHKKPPGLAASLRSLVHREYVEVDAVSDVSFTLEQGELVGFLGPNGAGKTTTLKMLSGLLHPSGGTATVLGYEPWKRDHRFQRRFSLVMGQKNQLWWDLPAIESFLLNKEIYGVSDELVPKNTGRARRSSGAGTVAPDPGASTIARRAYEVRAGRRAHSSARSAVSR